MDLKIKFQFDKEIKESFYSAKYFLTSKKILESQNNKKSLLRFKHFNKNIKIAGINEVLQLIEFALPKDVYKNTTIYYVNEGKVTNDDEPILALEGNYKDFAFLENIIDGILTRRSSIATNCQNIINLVGTEKLIFMADRCDDYSLQPYDGYAAYIGGVTKFVTNAHAKFLNSQNVQVLGTIPHALIQQFKGSLSQTLKAYNNTFPNSPIVGLIDFNNDCLNEIKELKENNITKLDYVRIDTSKKLIDKSLQEQYAQTNDDSLFGVNHQLVCKVREQLDKLGYKETKIIVSSSINVDTIKDYINKKTPIDIYGVGKSLLNINLNFTGDLVRIGNQYLAKVGRNENIDSYLNKMNRIH